MGDKSSFSANRYKTWRSPHQMSRCSGRLGQRRFWEKKIKNNNDLRCCVDCCYISPFKHGYAKAIVDWLYSSFHRDVEHGVYPSDRADDTQDNDSYGEP